MRKIHEEINREWKKRIMKRSQEQQNTLKIIIASMQTIIHTLRQLYNKWADVEQYLELRRHETKLELSKYRIQRVIKRLNNPDPKTKIQNEAQKHIEGLAAIEKEISSKITVHKKNYQKRQELIDKNPPTLESERKDLFYAIYGNHTESPPDFILSHRTHIALKGYEIDDGGVKIPAPENPISFYTTQWLTKLGIDNWQNNIDPNNYYTSETNRFAQCLLEIFISFTDQDTQNQELLQENIGQLELIYKQLSSQTIDQEKKQAGTSEEKDMPYTPAAI